MKSILTFHHTGLLVENIKTSLHHYMEVFGQENVSEIYEVHSQGVKVCFVKNGVDSYLELVSPSSGISTVNNMLKKRISYYHIAYNVSDIEQAISELETLNYKSLKVFKSEAFEMKRCCFLFTPDAHLIELIES